MSIDPTFINKMLLNRQARRDLAEEYEDLRQEAIHETGGNGTYETDTHIFTVKQKTGTRLSVQLVKQEFSKKDLTNCYIPTVRTTVTIKLKDEVKAQVFGAAEPGTKPIIRYE